MKLRISRLRLLVITFAWVAQLCLPVAHAAAMGASSAAGAPAWCGPGSPLLQARIAELAPKVRDILGLDDPAFERLDHCAELCAASTAPALPETPSATERLRAAGLEIKTSQAVPPASRGNAPPPPARGPPTRG